MKRWGLLRAQLVTAPQAGNRPRPQAARFSSPETGSASRRVAFPASRITSASRRAAFPASQIDLASGRERFLGDQNLAAPGPAAFSGTKNRRAPAPVLCGRQNILARPGRNRGDVK